MFLFSGLFSVFFSPLLLPVVFGVCDGDSDGDFDCDCGFSEEALVQAPAGVSLVRVLVSFTPVNAHLLLPRSFVLGPRVRTNPEVSSAP